MPYAEHSPPVTAHIGWAFRRLQIIPPRWGGNARPPCKRLLKTSTTPQALVLGSPTPCYWELIGQVHRYGCEIGFAE